MTTTLGYWTELAQLLERGLFDGLLIADIPGVYEVYGGDVELTLCESIQLPVNDPFPLVLAVAATTLHLGFGLTANFALVGDPRQVADALLGWIDETGLDGFNLARTVTPECCSDFVDLVIPALQSRGRYKTAYVEGSFRHKLFGRGDRLDSRHVGTRFRQD